MNRRQMVRLHIEMAVIGGLSYNLLELLWRGRTHWSMFFIGGVCFELIGLVVRRVRVPYTAKCGLCALTITVIEFISGCIINLWLKLAVWDYGTMRFNIKGQVCLLYSIFWLVISAVVMPLYGLLYKQLFRRRLTKRGERTGDALG